MQKTDTPDIKLQIVPADALKEWVVPSIALLSDHSVESGTVAAPESLTTPFSIS